MSMHRRMAATAAAVGFVLVLRLAAPGARAAAQGAYASDGGRLSIGAAIGRLATSADDVATPRGADLTGTVEAPIGRAWVLRAQVGRTRLDIAPRLTPVDPLPADRLVLRRLTVGFERNLPPFSFYDSRLRPYVLAGVGAYRYGFSTARAANRTRMGLHGGLGFEYAFGEGHTALSAEVVMHGVGGPSPGSALRASTLLLGTFAIGFRARF